ncbi:MAG: VWA domain-containing protein [Planctomycetales bacterium]
MKRSRMLLGLAAVAGCLLVGRSAPAEGPKSEGEAGKPRIQMAILLDTSGSMNGLINQARTQIWKIVNELATAKRDGKSPDLRVALYEYGKSSLPASEGHLRQIVPLTDDLDKISEELFALTTNGGSEHCGQVIDAATKGLAWSGSDADLKLIYIAGNEPFTQGPVDYREACQAAVKRGIVVNTIFCGPEAEGVRTMWQDGARISDGLFASIDQNQAVAEVKTPFDEKLAALGGEINKTYVAYGKKAERENLARRQVAQDANAKAAAPAAAAERAAFKSSGQYRNAAWDLLDALDQKTVKLEDVKDEDLPEELRKLSLEERQAHLDKKREERAKIQGEIKELSEKRSEFIAEARLKEAEAAGKQTLDAALIRSIRTQAEKKQFQFEQK